MLEKFQRRSATNRLLEEKLYEQVVQELVSGQRRDGLWAKALANSDGLEGKAKALYVRYRVQSIKDEIEVNESINEEAIKARAAQLSDPVNRARNCGLSEDQIAYLGTPIEAVRYVKKYRNSEKKLSKAISQGRIRGVIFRGVLWVQDRKYT
ncbi:hypothetical protein H2508_09795 [Parahaliea sp. F7430]|uniref:Uncharacterized protein n=1 Tax=Sediminihaliea albiluteola TaxID=2758564 RepID=A0A7W2TX22_9GAMM|nr:hypothetical protein [Sediminihaliea albiluteola]MBA6413399.1 hypothetical protein [Sediminihaliea albiluteola]